MNSKSYFRVQVWLAVAALALLAHPLRAQVLTPQVDSLVMRDGRKLAADIHLVPGGAQRPTILIQTPYNRLLFRLGLPLGTGQNLASSPYHFVVVDWRGFYGSVAATVPNYDRGLDGYDLVEWIAAQPWSDGQVATWGPSALGVIQFQTAKHQPPHLVACVPLVADPRFLFPSYYTGGALRTEYVNQLDSLGYGLGPLVRANPAQNVVWNVAANNSTYPQSIAVPMLSVAGWYDHNLVDQLDYFELMRAQSAPAVRSQHRILVGPWAHGGFTGNGPGSGTVGELSFPQAAGVLNPITNRFLAYYLLDSANGWDTTSTYTYFKIGPNTWNTANSWPPVTQLRTFFLTESGTLDSLLPATPAPVGVAVDPRTPTPTIGGATLDDDLLQGPWDQAPLVEGRSDVALFSTEALAESVEIAGAPVARIWASTTQPDADVAIRLTDVYPDGRSILVWDGIRRLRYAQGYTPADTGQVAPGTVVQLEIDLPPLAYTWLSGHRIRLVVSGNNYPRFDLNLQNGGAIFAPGDSLPGTLTVHTGPSHPSQLRLPVLMSLPTGHAGAAPLPAPFRLAPNPTSGQLAVTELPLGPSTLVLRDATGRQVAQWEAHGPTAHLSLHHLPAGAYWLQAFGHAGAQRVLLLPH
jgi:predicted acyl esterase